MKTEDCCRIKLQKSPRNISLSSFLYSEGNTVGGCQITSQGTAYNMGHILGRLEAAADGTLTIRYTGGDICHLGTAQAANRSTRILFYCSTIEVSLRAFVDYKEPTFCTFLCVFIYTTLIVLTKLVHCFFKITNHHNHHHHHSNVHFLPRVIKGLDGCFPTA